MGRGKTGNHGDTRKKHCANEKERPGTMLPKIPGDRQRLVVFILRVSFHGLVNSNEVEW